MYIKKDQKKMEVIFETVEKKTLRKFDIKIFVNSASRLNWKNNKKLFKTIFEKQFKSFVKLYVK